MAGRAACSRACPTKVESGFVEKQATTKNLEAGWRFYLRQTGSRPDQTPMYSSQVSPVFDWTSEIGSFA
jgi:hypothetical protein